MSVIDLSSVDKLLVERAARIRMLVLDVDGVLTDGRLYFDNQGNEMKAFCTRDGLGMRALQSQGTILAFITGRQSEIVTHRAAQLGVEHVYQGRIDKLNAFHELLSDTGMDEQQICYAGDDWIDIPVLDRWGWQSPWPMLMPLSKTGFTGSHPIVGGTEQCAKSVTLSWLPVVWINRCWTEF